jgi:hypothetical protein
VRPIAVIEAGVSTIGGVGEAADGGAFQAGRAGAGDDHFGDRLAALVLRLGVG